MRHQKAPRHAEMHHQHLAGREIGQQILGPPPERRDLLALAAARRNGPGNGNRRSGRRWSDSVKRAPDHGGLQAAAHGFDFGELGHQPSLRFGMAFT